MGEKTFLSSIFGFKKKYLYSFTVVGFREKPNTDSGHVLGCNSGQGYFPKIYCSLQEVETRFHVTISEEFLDRSIVLNYNRTEYCCTTDFTIR